MTPAPTGGPQPGEGSVDPDLEPYLEAAAEPEEGSPAARRAEQERRLARREADDAAALRELAASGLLGDLGDVEGDGEDDSETDLDGLDEDGGEPGGVVGGVVGAEQGLDPETAAYVADAELEARVDAVYQGIIARAPEHKVQPSLERVQAVLDLMGEPHRAYPVIHVAGTNGKTSTARMIEALLGARGLRTGRFTSPHLHSARERIAIDGAPISAEGFLAAWDDVAPYVEMVDQRSQTGGGPRLSFFEVFTVMAFAAFADAPVDVVVLEVGLGGRWDATNVADAVVEVLVPISRDHEQWLGSTLTEIANEKVGVITDRSVVVSAHQEPEVAEIVLTAAAQHGARLLRAGTEIEVADLSRVMGGQLVSLRTPAALYEDVIVPLHGAHQADNALLALAAVEAFFGGAALDPAAVETGMTAVTSPGRLEVLRTSPLVVVDSAHNPHGAAAAREAMTDTFGLERVVGVVAAMADKDHEGILAELEPLLDEVVVTTISTPRAAEAEDLAEVAKDVFGADRVHLRERLADAVEEAVTLAEAGSGRAMTATHDAALDGGGGLTGATTGVLVVGSVLLAAEARALFGRRA